MNALTGNLVQYTLNLFSININPGIESGSKLFKKVTETAPENDRIQASIENGTTVQKKFDVLRSKFF